MLKVATYLRGRTCIVLVLFHISLLAAYTLPERLVPAHIRVISGHWVRPLFHQDWKLFAPDPPVCSCELQYRAPGQHWASIDRGPYTWLQRRSVRALAGYVQAGVREGRRTPVPELVSAMHAMVYEGGASVHEAPVLRFRLVERCADDVRDPAIRSERVTLLRMP